MIHRYCNNAPRQQQRRFLPGYFINRLRAGKRRFSCGALAIITCTLSACMAPAIAPTADRISAIRSMLIVPVETPPLEVIPDPVKNRIPAYGQYAYENVPPTQLMREKIYRNPGGILIAGKVGSSDSVELAETQRTSGGAALQSSAALKDNWVSTLVLAEHAASTLSTGPVQAVMSKHFRRLPIAGENRTANLGHWHGAVRDWYAQDQSTVDYRQPGIGPVDAVLEIGVGSYRIFEGQTSLQVLLKLIDPGTGRVIGRARAEDISVEGSALALLGHEGENFKSVVTRMGTRLLTNGLSELGLAQAIRGGGIKPDQILAENRLR